MKPNLLPFKLELQIWRLNLNGISNANNIRLDQLKK